MRKFNISVAEFWLVVLVLALSLVTILAGVRGTNTGIPIATFNTSSLGLDAYHDPSSSLHDAVVSLIPSDVVNPPSITQYLNVKDWYIMHYFSVCSGYYIPSSSNPSVLTSSTTNITCVRRYSGYSFSLHDTITSTLSSEVIGLAEKMTAQRWSTRTAISAWYTGVSNVFLSFVALSFALWCGRAWWSETIIMSLIAWLCFFIGSGIMTHQILSIQRLSGSGVGPNPYPGSFLALTWACSVFQFLAFCIRWLGIRTVGREWVLVGRGSGRWRWKEELNWKGGSSGRLVVRILRNMGLG
ncbi:uncharacterized protein K444DRAFT_665763 [Hyaloscypha bicolor E]|uniref:Integral membrane protein-like protein n=1 Tax=Hyaloscypha bicolor E TaxID=1095630 RepID=A0A2J6T310_9HELO|nr:uncharacterized protein K444DRAFT_665763 [Hyaloscypha bicolor E]PMD57410.1 hypothetical protein K444DRAFT_665763 [Hyaloscypha bicolor E]